MNEWEILDARLERAKMATYVVSVVEEPIDGANTISTYSIVAESLVEAYIKASRGNVRVLSVNEVNQKPNQHTL